MECAQDKDAQHDWQLLRRGVLCCWEGGDNGNTNRLGLFGLPIVTVTATNMCE